jgi:predicted dehydrogenase
MSDEITASFKRTPVYGQAKAPSLNVLGANERIGLGFVGLEPCHGMDSLFYSNPQSIKKNSVVVAYSDWFRYRRERAGRQAKLRSADLYSDYREMLERKDIDAVLIGAHDPVHAQISLDALEAGKHVHCAPPLGRHLNEAFSVYDKVRSTAKVLQIGVANCSTEGWQKCAGLVRDGGIGTLVWGQGFYCRNSVGGEWNYSLEPDCTSENVAWKQWLGPIPDRPFNPEHFRRWQKYHVYSAGLLGELATRRLSPLLLAAAIPEFPTRVACISTQPVHADRMLAGTPERDVSEHVQLLAEFPSGYSVTITCSTVNSRSPGSSLYGRKATLTIGASGESLTLTPEKEFATEITPQTVSRLPPEDVLVHLDNWFNCIRTGKQPNGDVELAIRVQTVLSLAEMSDRLKIVCLFNEKTRSITDAAGREIMPFNHNTYA